MCLRQIQGRHTDEIKVKSTEFKYKDINDIKNDLVKEIGLIADKKIKAFEESFHVHLNLSSITENYNSFSEGYNSLNQMSAGFAIRGTRTEESSVEVLDVYPEKKFYYTLNFRYNTAK